ncbi:MULTISPECIES: AEC family transporter [Eubacterium]|uniref:Membrane transport protein n=1 Tax=Eubacterium ruminantium TaxID=42322 RepID=A0A1T4KIR0_9FIRM|nr:MULTISPECIES: AEC family transporter [Eubacterium]MCR5367083.1 AEC family transporter [Eubacterium sp.]SCW32374.1 Membrane transport protein [Eubacterium ruminantium]SDM27845.1 Membrane transport protein [Eubacterium ruminantium]SJZ42281.1 Membrane transport protein [Eubacterium ruminantium]
MSSEIVLQQMGVITILVAIGIYLYKRKTIDDTVSQKLSVIIMDICNPALILASILSGNITATHKDLITALILGASFYAGLIILGFILPKILRCDKYSSRFYNLMTIYTNVGFIGLPVARAILPENAILYVIVCNVMYSLLFYTHGLVVLSNGKEKMKFSKIFSPGTITAILALVVFWFDYKPPRIINDSISFIGNATVFLSMTLLGVSIARSNFIKGFKNIRIWLYIAIRMIIVPIGLFFALKAMKFNSVTILGLCLMAAMPVGNLPLIQSEKMGEDTEILSNAIAISTIVSIISITVLMSVFSANV